MHASNPSTSPPQPFSPGQPSSIPGGCGRPVWIGCALVILVMGIAAMIFLWKAPDLFEWAMGEFESEVMRSLPAEVTPDQRARLEDAFVAAREGVADGTADPLALQELLTGRVMSPEDVRTVSDVEELTAALEAVGRTGEVDVPLEEEIPLEEPVLDGPGS